MSASKRLKERSIQPTQSILSALKKMDALEVKSLPVMVDENKLHGILSIGDIQRAIIRNETLDQPVKKILRDNPRLVRLGVSKDEVMNLMTKHRMEFLPVVNEYNDVVDCFFWEDLFPETTAQPTKKIEVPVVIMAGGMGTRLRPLTNVLPKPLIPIGEKTMLEEIFDRFASHGCKEFYISVNYKANLIEYYICQQNLPYYIEFFREEKPLGTAGSLCHLQSKIKTTFFVTNCDILIQQAYSEILDYHSANNNEITIVAALKHYPIPYGVLETGENGHLLALTEKPELTFKINSGMYVLEPHLLHEVPLNNFFHITELIEKIQKRKGAIGAVSYTHLTLPTKRIV